MNFPLAIFKIVFVFIRLGGLIVPGMSTDPFSKRGQEGEMAFIKGTSILQLAC